MSSAAPRHVSGMTTAWLVVAAVAYVAGVIAVVESPSSVAAGVSAAVVALVMLCTGAIIVLRTEVARLGWLLVATGATIHHFTSAEAVEMAARTDAHLLWLSIIGLSPVPLMLAVVLFPSGRATIWFASVLVWFTVAPSSGSTGCRSRRSSTSSSATGRPTGHWRTPWCP